MNFNEIHKTVAALVLGLLGWATAVVQSPETAITATEWIMLGTALAVSLGVYGWANEPKDPPPLVPDVPEV